MRVRGAERASDLVGDEGAEARRRRAERRHRAQQRAQLAAVDELHHDGVLAAGLDDVEHLRDVGVRQPRGQARLVEERGAQLGVGEPLGQEPLERHRAGKAVGATLHGTPDLGAAAAAEARQKLELAESRASCRV